MSRNVRRAAGSILVLAAGGIAAAGFLSGGHDRVEVSASARLAADGARRVIEQAWQTELRLAEQRVSEAIASKPLQAAVAERAPASLQAKLAGADWWRPIRDDFQVVRIELLHQALLALGHFAALDFAVDELHRVGEECYLFGHAVDRFD